VREVPLVPGDRPEVLGIQVDERHAALRLDTPVVL
jgi:hypothetical protein